MFPIGNSLSSGNAKTGAPESLPHGNVEGVKGKQFAEKLGEFMSARDMSKADVARALNVSPSAVTKWTKGEQVPESPLFLALARALDVDPFDLMGTTIAPTHAAAKPKVGRPRRLAAALDVQEAGEADAPTPSTRGGRGPRS